MSNAGQSKTKELKDWYEQRNWPFLGGPMSMGDYIAEMAKRILDELKETGSCWLTESALSKETIRAWDWNAVLMAYSRRFASPFGFPMREEDYSVYYRLKPDMKKLLTQLCGSFTQEPARSKKEAPETANSSRAEQQAALQKLTEQKKTVEKQLESLREEVREQNNRVTQLRQEEISLEKHLQELREQVAQTQRIPENTQEEARQILEQARAEAERIRQSVIHEAAAEELAAPARNPDTSGVTEDEMEAATHQLENRLRDDLVACREQVESMLIRFRTGLYATKYASVCDAYQKLYLFATGMMDKRIAALRETAGDEATLEAVTTELRSIQGLLLKRISRLERGLEAMGLTILRPAQGSAYDCNEHAAENAEDDGTLTGVVRQCVCPGVRDETQVFCPASVLLEEARDESSPE